MTSSTTIPPARAAMNVGGSSTVAVVTRRGGVMPAQGTEPDAPVAPVAGEAVATPRQAATSAGARRGGRFTASSRYRNREGEGPRLLGEPELASSGVDAVYGEQQQPDPVLPIGADLGHDGKGHIGRDRGDRDGRKKDGNLAPRRRYRLDLHGHRAYLLGGRDVEQNLGAQRGVLALSERERVGRRLGARGVGRKDGDVPEDRPRNEPAPLAGNAEARTRVERDLDRLAVADGGRESPLAHRVDRRRDELIARRRQHVQIRDAAVLADLADEQDVPLRVLLLGILRADRRDVLRPRRAAVLGEAGAAPKQPQQRAGENR